MIEVFLNRVGNKIDRRPGFCRMAVIVKTAPIKLEAEYCSEPAHL
jgi:hypothetical protein